MLEDVEGWPEDPQRLTWAANLCRHPDLAEAALRFERRLARGPPGGDACPQGATAVPGVPGDCPFLERALRAQLRSL